MPTFWPHIISELGGVLLFTVLDIYTFGGGEQKWEKEESSEFPAKFQLFHSFLAVSSKYRGDRQGVFDTARQFRHDRYRMEKKTVF